MGKPTLCAFFAVLCETTARDTGKLFLVMTTSWACWHSPKVMKDSSLWALCRTKGLSGTRFAKSLKRRHFAASSRSQSTAYLVVVIGLHDHDYTMGSSSKASSMPSSSIIIFYLWRLQQTLAHQWQSMQGLLLWRGSLLVCSKVLLLGLLVLDILSVLT